MHLYFLKNRSVGIFMIGCGLIMFSCLATCQLNAETFVDQDTYFEGDRFWSLPVRDLGTCAVLCLRMTKCDSFNFDLSTRKCEMNSDILETNQHLGKSQRGSVYSRIKHSPQELDPDCFLRPCKPNEVCIPQQLSKHLTNQPRCLNAMRKHGHCRPLSDPINGAVRVAGNQAGDTANYTCNNLYALIGDRTRTCQSDGLWNGTEPTCTNEVRKWVSSVTAFSSQYGDDSWSADQVVGAPNVYPDYGDRKGTWAPKVKDANQYIEVRGEIIKRQ